MQIQTNKLGPEDMAQTHTTRSRPPPRTRKVYIVDNEVLIGDKMAEEVDAEPEDESYKKIHPDAERIKREKPLVWKIMCKLGYTEEKADEILRTLGEERVNEVLKRLVD